MELKRALDVVLFARIRQELHVDRACFLSSSVSASCILDQIAHGRSWKLSLNLHGQISRTYELQHIEFNDQHAQTATTLATALSVSD